jgi:hypothetical protein
MEMGLKEGYKLQLKEEIIVGRILMGWLTRGLFQLKNSFKAGEEGPPLELTTGLPTGQKSRPKAFYLTMKAS